MDTKEYEELSPFNRYDFKSSPEEAVENHNQIVEKVAQWLEYSDAALTANT